MIIGSNKQVDDCSIHGDVHIHNAEQVIIRGCIIEGNIIAHGSCKRLIIMNCTISGTWVVPDVTDSIFQANIVGNGRAIDYETELQMIEQSKEYIKRHKGDDSISAIERIPVVKREDSLIY